MEQYGTEFYGLIKSLNRAAMTMRIEKSFFSKIAIIAGFIIYATMTKAASVGFDVNNLSRQVLNEMPTELVENLPKNTKIILKSLNPQQINICTQVPVGFNYAHYQKKIGPRIISRLRLRQRNFSRQNTWLCELFRLS